MKTIARTTNKGCCATCVTRLVWHEVRDGNLLYRYNGAETVVGSTRVLFKGLSPRFFCPAHSEVHS